MTSLSVVSEIAMVPDSECRMPTLIVSSAALADVASGSAIAAASASEPRIRPVDLNMRELSS